MKNFKYVYVFLILLFYFLPMFPIVEGQSYLAYQDVLVYHNQNEGSFPVRFTFQVLSTLDPNTQVVTLIYPTRIIYLDGGLEPPVRDCNYNATHSWFVASLNASSNPIRLRVYFSQVMINRNDSGFFGWLPIIISPDNAQTNVTVQITIDSASLIRAGLLKADCSDIRIYDSDRNTVLPYMITNKNSSNTIITIFFSSISAQRKIWLAFSNPQATSMEVTTPPFPILYNYKNITLTSSTSVSDYQVRFFVFNTTGTDSGFNIYLGNKVRQDFGDVRFTLTNGTLLPYWIESINNTCAIFWVRVPSIPGTIQIWYNNPSATSIANGNATFLFFDDFESYTAGQQLPTTKWPHQTAGWRIFQDGSVKVVRYEGGSSVTQARAFSNVNITQPFAVEARMKSESGRDAGVFICATSDTSTTYGYGYMVGWGSNGASASIFYFAGSTASQLAQLTNAVPTSYERITVIRTSGNSMMLYRGGTLLVQTSHSTYTSGLIGIAAWYNLYPAAYFDWIAVRNYVSPEPTVSSISSEGMVQTFNGTISFSQPQSSTSFGSLYSTITIAPVQVQVIRPMVANITINGTFTFEGMPISSIQLVVNSTIGQIGLRLLPIVMTIAAAASFTCAIVGGFICAICAFVNYSLGYNFFDTMLLGWLAAICILFAIVEQRRRIV